MSFCDGEDEKSLQFQQSCEVFLAAFVTMRVDTESLVTTKGPNMSKPNGKSDKESSVDVAGNRELLRAVDELEVDDVRGRLPSGLVPAALPSSLRGDPASVEQQHVSQMYDLQSAVRYVKEGVVAKQEVIALHLKSFRNILLYEFNDVELLQRRFRRFFASVFMDLVELCYPDRGDSKLVGFCYVCIRV